MAGCAGGHEGAGNAARQSLSEKMGADAQYFRIIGKRPVRSGHRLVALSPRTKPRASRMGAVLYFFTSIGFRLDFTSTFFTSTGSGEFFTFTGIAPTFTTSTGNLSTMPIYIASQLCPAPRSIALFRTSTIPGAAPYSMGNNLTP